MLTRGSVLVLLLALAAPVSAQIFELDERIRPHPDGRLVLPAPFDTDAKLPITAGGVLEGCEAAYAFCEPAPVSCAEPPCCGETSPDPGETLRIGRPELPNHLPRFVDVNVMSGGSCYGNAQQDAKVLYFELGDLGAGALNGPPEDCFWCVVAMWMYSVGVSTECPAFACVDDEELAGYFCALLGALEDAGLSTNAARATSRPAPRAIDAAGSTTTLRTLRDGVMAPTAAGQHYVGLYTTHSPELIRVAARRPWLVWMIGDALDAWMPAFAALAGGTGATVTLTPQMIADLQAILDELGVEADDATRAAIATERQRLDPPSFAGLDMDAAWARVQEKFAGPPAGCGDGFAGADCALGELLADDLCAATEIDGDLLALYDAKVAKARAVLAKAAAGGKPGKVRRLLRKTAKHLKVLARRTSKAKSLDAACRETLGTLVETRREQVLALGG
jgi:hypothetical protein